MLQPIASVPTVFTTFGFPVPDSLQLVGEICTVLARSHVCRLRSDLRASHASLASEVNRYKHKSAPASATPHSELSVGVAGWEVAKKAVTPPRSCSRLADSHSVMSVLLQSRKATTEVLTMEYDRLSRRYGLRGKLARFWRRL